MVSLRGIIRSSKAARNFPRRTALAAQTELSFRAERLKTITSSSSGSSSRGSSHAGWNTKILVTVLQLAAQAQSSVCCHQTVASQSLSVFLTLFTLFGCGGILVLASINNVTHTPRGPWARCVGRLSVAWLIVDTSYFRFWNISELPSAPTITRPIVSVTQFEEMLLGMPQIITLTRKQFSPWLVFSHFSFVGLSFIFIFGQTSQAKCQLPPHALTPIRPHALKDFRNLIMK